MPLKALRAVLAAGLGIAAVAAGAAPASLAATDGPTRLAVAVPLVVPPTDTGLIEATALTQYTREGGLLDRQLDALEGRQVAIGVDPRIIASIRVLGSAAPETATAWLERLDALTNQTFPLAYADTDLALVTQAGAPAVPGAEGFAFAIDPAAFAPPVEGTPTPTPTATPDPLEPPPLPDATAVTAWEYTLDAVAWPRDDTVVAGDLPRFAASGYESAIVSSGNLTREDESGAAVVDGFRVAVSDAAISAALRQAVGSAEYDIGAVIAAASATGDDGTVLATMDRSVPMSTDRLAAVLDALAADPGVELVPLSQVLGEAAAAASIADRPEPADRVRLAAALLESDAATARFATVATDPAAITDPERLRMLALLSNAWAANGEGWASAAADAVAVGDALRDSVQIASQSTLNLLGDQRTSLPVPISNALDQEVTVYVTVRPTTARLSVGEERVAVTVPAQSQANALVPVQAITNGSVYVRVTLTSGAGIDIGDQRFVQMNVQAGWETPVVVVVAILVFAVFVVGIVRTILRRRRERAEAAG
ncbi:MAG TPA: DUF6049 family protein [Rhodoglobus sp.]|nr:DUF6049 family protein [Rhodoglobus sp.]